MPWTAKQLKLFRAAAHNPAIAKSSGIKQTDAERMSKEGLKKAKGGAVPAMINRQDTRHGKMDMPYQKLNRFAGMKEGGAIMRSKKDIGKDQMSMAPYKKGGEMESKAMMKKEIGFMQKKGAPASMIKHEKAEMKGMARGGGIELKWLLAVRFVLTASIRSRKRVILAERCANESQPWNGRYCAV
jgi:hypothetical protein